MKAPVLSKSNFFSLQTIRWIHLGEKHTPLHALHDILYFAPSSFIFFLSKASGLAILRYYSAIYRLDVARGNVVTLSGALSVFGVVTRLVGPLALYVAVC